MPSDFIRVGVLGATSHVSKPLLSILNSNGYGVFSFSRSELKLSDKNIWIDIDSLSSESVKVKCSSPQLISYWISLLPLWVLIKYLPLIDKYQPKRIVALSTTSLFTKTKSGDPGEQRLVKNVAAAEEQLKRWAEERGIEWVIIRPTLIYGYGQDKNISSIKRIIKYFGFFPVFGQANGLRQPVHAEDVATACFSALFSLNVKNRSYNIAGADVLTYREMVCRIFTAMGRTPRLLTVPLFFFKAAVVCLRMLPRYRYLSLAMVERMNINMIFEYNEAKQDFNYKPRSFDP